MLKRILSLIWTILLIVGIPSYATAQTSPNPLQTEVDEAEARAKIAKARKDELEARFPTPDADALKASTSVKGDLIETRIQAYRAMNNVSEQIARKIKGDSNIGGLVVFRDSDYAMVVSYLRILRQLEAIDNGYKICKAGGGIRAESLAPGVVANLLLNALPLFKTDTTINAVEFDIEEEAFWANLAENLSKKDSSSKDSLFLRRVSLYNLFVSPFNIEELNKEVSQSALKESLKTVENSRISAECAEKIVIDKAFEKLKVDMGIEESENPQSPPTTPAATRSPTPTPTPVPAAPTATATTTVNVNMTSPQATPPSSTSASNSFLDYLRVERFVEAMKEKKIYWIKIKNIKAGGSMRVKSSPLIDIFRGGNSVKFSGGSVAYYYLLDNQGTIVQSGNLYGYAPYKKSSQVGK